MAPWLEPTVKKRTNCRLSFHDKECWTPLSEIYFRILNKAGLQEIDERNLTGHAVGVLAKP